eukprot:SAG31_NODE_617_length_13514_cov_13.659858_2_plen_4275_part_00
MAETPRALLSGPLPIAAPAPLKRKYLGLRTPRLNAETPRAAVSDGSIRPAPPSTAFTPRPPNAASYRPLVRAGINQSKHRGAVPDELYQTLPQERPQELAAKQNWREMAEDWTIGPTIRTQEMGAKMTPRTFKVANNVPVQPTQLLSTPREKQKVIDSTPSERIGCLYTKSAIGMSPRLMQEGLSKPTGAGQGGLLTTGAVSASGESILVNTVGGPTLAQSEPPERLSHWGAHGGPNKALKLEWFDQAGYEDPAKWAGLETGSIAAKSKFLGPDGEMAWKSCEVAAYNPAENHFTIKWSDTGKTKEVSRLNLLLDSEDQAEFEQRIATAKRLRDLAENTMRTNLFIEKAPAGDMQTMDREQTERMLRMVGTEIPESAYDMISDLVRGIETEYLRCQSKATLNYLLKAEEETRLMQGMGFMVEPTPTSISTVDDDEEVIAARAHATEVFLRTREQIFDKLFFATPSIVQAMQQVYQDWQENRQHLLFVSVAEAMAELPLPCQLHDYKQWQESKRAAVLANLLDSWIPATVNIMMDNLESTFDFYCHTMDAVEGSDLQRFLKYVSLFMTDGIHEIMMNSIDQWVRFQSQFDFNSGLLLKEPRLTPPLLVLQLKIVEGELHEDGSVDPPTFEFSPPLQVCCDTILSMFDKSVDSLSSIPQIDHLLMPLVEIGESFLPSVGLSDPSVADVRVKIKTMLTQARAGPLALANQFVKYCELLSTSSEEYAEKWGEGHHMASADRKAEEERLAAEEALLSGSGPIQPEPDEDEDEDDEDEDGEREPKEPEGPQLPNLEQIRAELASKRAAHRAVLEECPDEVLFPTFLIRTREVKETVAAGAERLVAVVLESNATAARRRNEAIIAGFEDMIRRAQEEPETIEALTELKSYIDHAEQHMTELKGEIADMVLRLESFEEFKYVLSDEDYDLACRTRLRPAAVKEALEEAGERLEDLKRKMLESFMTERDTFETEISQMGTDADEFQTFGDLDQLEMVAEKLASVCDRLDTIDGRLEKINSREVLFDFPPTNYPEIFQIRSDFDPFMQLWQMAVEFKKSQPEWMFGNFLALDSEKITDIIQSTSVNSYKLKKKFKEQDEPIAICEKLKAEVDDFSQHLPLITALTTPGLKEKHWDKISENIGISLKPTPELTLNELNKLEVAKHLEEIEKVAEEAAKEWSLESALAEMKGAWAKIEFVVLPYRDSGTYVLTALDDNMQLLDDQVVKTQTMLGSPFMQGQLRKDTDEWEKKLKTMVEVLDEWLKVQRNWLYLEPIFGSEDIMRQMPVEGKKFKGVDEFFRKMMTEAKEQKNILNVCMAPDLVAQFLKFNDELDAILRGLNQYLEMKRLAFPRFFFLSNDELLEILSQTKDPKAVQPHLGKCFENIVRLEFKENLDIVSMFSGEGEKVGLLKTIKPTAQVESWLLEVEVQMRETLADTALKALQSYATDVREEWMLEQKGQMVLAGSQYYWTQEVEEAIRDSGYKGLAEYVKKMKQQLDNVTALARTKLTKMHRKSIGALVTMDVHAKDVTEEMVRDQVNDIDAFEWLSQLRYYKAENTGQVLGVTAPEILVCKMISSTLPYYYEYLGNSFRLVVTPLTDRCYRTLMGALALNLGGAPEGPAGTGKTETTKDLAKALAKQCVVFNCSDSMDFRQMAKFFKGLASSGAWACFDEFNRIDLEVLSVIAQQLITIQAARNAKLKKFIFEGTEIGLDPSNAAFITMNPGYAGRSALPDNLKALFRTVAMMVPNYALIAEIRLLSSGYNDARNLARKIVSTFKLSSEQLSSQSHYDFGMRAVMSVLTASARLKEQEPNTTEDNLVLRSIRDCNIPKFLIHDLPLFNAITTDLFPGVNLQAPDYEYMLERMKFHAAKAGLIATDGMIDKCCQLYETIMVRHGLMLVGQPYAGKTSCYQTLAKAMGDVDKTEVIYKIMNPKSILMGQLYGCFDDVSHEWSDGVLAITVRKCAMDPSPNRKWVVFDGPVDAIWIENMNTVLDDNKKLCLNSGEIIKLSEVMTMMFECADLAVASPATVSRCGMVYMEPETLGWRPIVDAFFENKLPSTLQEDREFLSEIFDWLIPGCCYFIRKNCRELVATTDIMMVQGMCRMFEAHLDDFRPNAEGNTPNAPDGKKKLEILEGLLIFALVWSVGASVDEKGRGAFDEYLRKELSGEVEEGEEPKRKSTVQIPDKETVYDYYFVAGKWKLWESSVEDLKIADNTPFHEITVPTIDTFRNAYWLKTMIDHKYHLLFCGPTGTGKTQCVQDMLMNGLDKAKWIPINLSFSAATTAMQTQNIIDSKLDKRRKGVFGAPFGKRCVIFVDDLNMPAKEEYGAQPPIELLRQWMDHGGWYDLGDKSFRKIVDVQFLAAMGIPGGGRTFITDRYLRHYNVVCLCDYSQSSLTRIFGTVMTYFLRPFSRDVGQLSENIVTATLELYYEAQKILLPTPSKSHYLFNLRDISSVVSGMMQASPSTVPDSDTVVKLWYHECARIFYDRLTDDPDRFWFNKFMDESVTRNFKKNWATLKPEDGNIPMYGHFMDMASDPPAYVEIVDMPGLKNVMHEQLSDYNVSSTKPMDLVLFGFALDHIARIARVIRQPFGNCLLVGVGGSGRQSCTRLAAHCCDMDVVSIEISKKYGTAEWRDDLKELLKKGGGAGEATVFLFNDSQIVLESFLEDINNILNTGEVPNIFDAGELAEVVDLVRPAAKQAGMGEATIPVLFKFFVDRCRQNIHIVLAMSPIGDAFRTRLRMYPSLVNCCTIDWFTRWPSEALQSVADHFLRDIEMEDEVKGKCADMFAHMHNSVSDLATEFLAEHSRHYYVTPTSYLELINTFSVLLAERRLEVKTVRNRYVVGLDKLNSTADQVKTMETELIALQPVLVNKTTEVNELMEKIKVDSAEAGKVKAVVSVEEAAASKQAAEADALKTECETDLAAAMPALQAALAALDTLNKGDITEVKGMKSPPPGVILVMHALCTLMEVKIIKKNDPDKPGKKIDDPWETAKKEFLNDAKFLQRLYAFDKDNIPDEAIEKVQPFLENPDFAPDVVAKASKAAKGLSMWIAAMEKYHTVSKVVGPKREMLEKATKELAEVTEALEKKKASLKAVEDKLQQLSDDYDKAIAEKESLANQVADCEAKLIRANKLIGGLGGEKKRWEETAAQLADAMVNITGDVLVSSGVIAYLGAFILEYRTKCADNWMELLKEKEIPGSPDCSLVKVLGQPVVMRQWVIYALPTDNFSMENAIIATKSRRWPLMIDPQGQANKFVKNMEEEAGLAIIKLSDPNFVRTLENCIQFGNPVILENVGEKLDPVLDTVLQKQTFKQGGRICIKIGDNVVEYSPDFRFYITTKLRNPHYSPETSVKVTLINFMATPAGLEDQMLGIVVEKERPQLAQAKADMIIENASMKKQLKELEDEILEQLSNAEGNILDNAELIEILSQAKVTSNEVQAKVAKAAVLEQQIDEDRKLYIPVAKRTSTLFFCISDLCIIDPMYQYSLVWFVNLFITAIERCEADPENLDVRLDALNDEFTYMLYRNVCRSLFEAHKLLFSFLLCMRILEGEGEVDMVLYRYMLTGAIAGRPDDAPDNPAKEWLTEKSWTELLAMADNIGFDGFIESFSENSASWHSYFESKTPSSELLPGEWQGKLNALQRLAVLRCLRPDAVVPAVTAFVKQTDLGSGTMTKYTQPPPFDLQACFDDSTCLTPLIFVLSAGADPFEDLMKLANSMGYGSKVASTSLGQGQGPIAEELIKQGVAQGTWVLLQNCHLYPSWMPQLEQICEKFTMENTASSFRLWLTSMPSPKIPVSVLQNGVKMTVEPPGGLKANLRNTYLGIDDEWFEASNKATTFKKLLFGLSFFHAVVQERRKFGPLGWNIPYEFNDTDYRISMRQLQLFIDGYDVTQWKALRYLAGQCNYGGRVTDDHDRRTLVSILADYFGESILNDSHKFAGTEAYYAPAEGDKQSYIDHVNSLPEHDDPLVFGMHRNAEITFARNQTQALLSAVLSIQPAATGGGGGKSADEIIDELAADIISRVPQPFDMEAAQKKYPTMYEESLNTVLCQEMVRFNRLIEKVHASLAELRKAVKGLVVMSQDLEAVAKSLQDGKVPTMWAKVAYPSMKPLGSWVLDLLQRLEFMQAWMDNGPPAIFWVSGFFFTQSFLTGTLQNFARQQTVPIDLLTFDFEVVEGRPEESAEDGCYIEGLFIEGARWDAGTGVLGESHPKVLFEAMPVIWLKVVQSSTIGDQRESGVYECPVYRTLERRGTLSTTGHSTNFVMEMYLPSDKPIDHWVQRGVAMLCALAD